MPPPRMLGQFEPILLGWESRTEIVGAAAEAQSIVTSNGIFRPFALVKGKAAATWKLKRRRSRARSVQADRKASGPRSTPRRGRRSDSSPAEPVAPVAAPGSRETC